MTEISGLPQWVWDLVRALQEYEEAHPPLYAYEGVESGVEKHKRTDCPGAAGVLDHIPDNVKETARAIDEYVRFAKRPEGS